MDQRLTFITLGVRDLAASKVFYATAFDWKPEPDTGGDVVFFKLNGMVLSLFPAEELAKDAGIPFGESGFRPFSLAHNVRSEAEVDMLVSLLRSRAVRIIKEPQKVFWGGYSAYIADPDGNLWEIAYNPFMPLDSSGNVSS